MSTGSLLNKKNIDMKPNKQYQQQTEIFSNYKCIGISTQLITVMGHLRLDKRSLGKARFTPELRDVATGEEVCVGVFQPHFL